MAMTNINPSEPDYEFWSKLNSWNFKDATLLLHGKEPLDYKQVSFTIKELPSLSELKEAYKTFLLLKNIPWGNDRPNAFQIAEAVLTKADTLEISPEGLKSLDRKIKEAFELVAEEGL